MYPPILIRTLALSKGVLLGNAGAIVCSLGESTAARRTVLAGLRLRWRSRPSLVDEVLNRAPEEAAASPLPGQIRVAAVQMALRPADDPAMWVEQCQALTQAAVRAGAQIVVFPALAAWGLVGAFGDPPLGTAIFGATEQNLTVSYRSAYARLYPALHRVQHRTFSHLAHRYRLTIVTGGLPAPRRTQAVLVATIFTEAGRLRLHQPAFAAGSLPTLELSYIKAGDDCLLTAVISDKASSDWLIPALSVEKADVLAVMAPGNAADFGDGAAMAAATGLYVVRAAMAGSVEPAIPPGRSGIYAPPDYSDTGSGILAQVVSDGEEEVVVATLDLARRRSGGASGAGGDG